jgi:hypothetical protein
VLGSVSPAARWRAACSGLLSAQDAAAGPAARPPGVQLRIADAAGRYAGAADRFRPVALAPSQPADDPGRTLVSRGGRNDPCRADRAARPSAAATFGADPPSTTSPGRGSPITPAAPRARSRISATTSLRALFGRAAELPARDLTLLVALPELVSPELARLYRAITDDDRDEAEGLLPAVLERLDTPQTRAARRRRRHPPGSRTTATDARCRRAHRPRQPLRPLHRREPRPARRARRRRHRTPAPCSSPP